MPATALSVAIAVAALAPSTAGAAFHLIKVREVYPGASDDSYVVLQMLAPGENIVGGRSLRIYDAGGATVDTFTFNSGYVAPNGWHGNNTLLVGDTGVQSRFGVSPDDHADAGLNIPAMGGAACWLSGSPPDCAAWGSFSGGGSLPSLAGTPADAFGIPAERALRRTIARRCATLLEAADDTDDSAADFFDAFPEPRPNSVQPTEHACSPPGQGGGGPGPGSAHGAPQTRIVRGPGRATRDRTPTFRFASSPAGAAFLCKLDRRRFRRCRSPFTTRRLPPGRHLFAVKARGANGATDPSPARYRFEVVKT